jgi:hypothetical protein
VRNTQRDIAKAISTSEKTARARNLQVTTQGALDKRILQQNLALNLEEKGVTSELRVDVITGT